MRSEKIRYASETEEDHVLTDSHLWALRELKRTPGIGPDALANRLGIVPASCVLLVSKLTESGYVSFVDGNGKELRDGCVLTDQGHSALAVLRKKAFLE
jgi:DNA-binding MarR family transcriptional regulator